AARSVTPVESEQPFRAHIQDKAQKAGVTTIVTVLGAFSDPKLPARDADVVLFHDVLHHIKERAAYLKATAQYVKPGGRIAVVELPPDGSHKDQPELVVTKDQVKGWMADAGFKPIQEFNGLTGNGFVFSGRRCSSPGDDASSPAVSPGPPRPFPDRARRGVGAARLAGAPRRSARRTAAAAGVVELPDASRGRGQ